MPIVSELPKAELHLHLEGSIEPETLCEIDPEVSPDEVRARYRYADFAGFIEAYKWVNLKLTNPEHYATATRRLLESLDRQRVVYAEINLSAGVVLWKKQNFSEVFQAIREGAAESNVRVAWILDAVRQFGPEHVMEVAELAVSNRENGVVGFGIGGDEARGRATDFADAFQHAKLNGLHIVPHAGETTGPQSVWDALEIGAERIGHGIRAIDDPELVRHLRDRQIPLESSVTSNVCTGAVASLEDHPVRRLFDAGVPIVINTDDPAMFHTTLNGEYELLRSRFGFNDQELEHLAGNGFRFAFNKVEVARDSQSALAD